MKTMPKPERDNGFRRDMIGEPDARRYVVVMQLTRTARRSRRRRDSPVAALQVEDCGLVVLLSGGEVQRPTRSDVGGQAVSDLSSRPEQNIPRCGRAGGFSLLLKIDLECVHLPQKKARDRVAAVCHTLLVRAGGGEGETPVGLGGATALNWYQRRSAPALNAWRPRVKVTVSTACQTAVWYCENVLAAGPSC